MEAMLIMNEYDMHVHTNYSDGILSPDKVIDLAVSNKLKGISITDHDSADGIKDALSLHKDRTLDIIPGIELSTTTEGEDVHILGYWIDYDDNKLLSMLSKIRSVRIQRIKKMVKNLYDYYKINVDINEVYGEGNQNALGRPHIARVLVKHGYAGNVSDAFKKYLNKNSPIYVEKFKLSPKDAIELIVGAKGAPVLAHPGLIGNKDLIPGIIEAGMYGIEVYHPKHSLDDIRMAQKLAGKYRLVETGGSDFHSPDTDNIGKCTISCHNVIELKEKLKS
jgi:hypothetical protein